MKKFLAALTVAVLSLFCLTACSTSGLQSGSSINIALGEGFNSINADNATLDASLAVNRQIADLLDPSFFYVDASGSLIPNTTFGSVKVISKYPYVVRYSLTGTAKWSDGQQLTASDLLLSWLAGKNPLDSGFNSNRAGTGLQWATSIPQRSADNLSLTVSYDHPVSDYRTALTISAAAHVVAEKAFALSDAAAALDRFNTAVSGAVLEDQKLIAAQYSQIYLEKNLQDAAAKIGAGAYLIDSYGNELKLKANSAFSWGPAVRIEKVNLGFYPDAPSALAAMHAGEVDIVAPQESGIATIANLSALAKSSGAAVLVGAGHQIESLLLNFRSGSVFADAKNATLRSAFLKLVPIAKILTAMSADSAALEVKSWIYANTSAYYAPFVQSNGSAAYAIQNAEQAQELLKSSGVRTPITVRVLYDSDNPRAKQEFALLGQYAKQVGFDLVDVSNSQPRLVYSTGEFDVYLTAVNLAGEVVGDPYWFTGSSVTGFKDDAVTAILNAFSTGSEEIDQVASLTKLDAQLYKSQFGLPLYQVPQMLVHAKRVTAIIPSPIGSSATYGYWNWSVSK